MRRSAVPRLALAGVIGLVLGAFPAPAQLIKLATLVPDGSVWDQAMEEMGDEWQRLSGGDVRLRIYPGGVAGDDSDVVRKMRIGQLQAGALTVNGLAELDPAFNVLAIPLFFDSYPELFHVLEVVGPVLQRRLEEKGFVLLNWGYGGWAHFFSSEPVRRVADLRELKIFTWAGDQEMVQWWKRNGFQPVPLAMTDVLTGLETGLIDAMPTTPLVALSLQWFRQTPYMHELKLAPVLGAMVVTRSVWEGIPAGTRALLEPAAQRVDRRLKEEIPEQDGRAVEEMVDRGLEITEVVDPEEWRREADRFASTMRGRLVPEEIFDQVAAAREAFRRRQTTLATGEPRP